MKTDMAITSLTAYDDLKGSKIQAKSYKSILNCMKHNAVYTRKQLAHMTGLDMCSVAGRVNELIYQREIKVVGHIKCPISNRLVEALQRGQ